MRRLQSQAEARRKLVAAARTSKPAFARNGRRLPPAFFLTDPKRTRHPVAIAERLPPGWGVIYRHFGAKDRFKVGAQLARVCRRRRLILLVSADPELARAIHADGIHWPEARLRRLRAKHPGWIETASAHSRAALVRTDLACVDAALLSSVFPSKSPSAPPAIGPRRFASRAASARLPVYALGGISPANSGRATRHAAGWAAIDAVLDGWG
jgi:thiamine-phosphate pyrophosphorylase